MRNWTESELNRLMNQCVILGKKTPRTIRVPHVGAIVLTADLEIIGRGHKKFLAGTRMTVHAERDAIQNAEMSPKKGIYLFTTLEPCVAKNDRQVFSPCCDLIVESGIQEVIFGLEDNSEIVHNRAGIKHLNAHGIRTIQYRGFKNDIKRYLMDPHIVVYE